MKLHLALALFGAVVLSASTCRSASSGSAFYGEPPDEHHPWAIHDRNRPQPVVVTPGTFSSQAQPGQPPSDAVVLFNGVDLSNWEATENGGPAKWRVADGVMEVVPKTGYIQTKEKFGDCQLHIEWAELKNIQGGHQGRGNSGVFLMGICEIQVLDSYNNATYADGGAGSVYGQHPPMANAVRPPGEFQVYDIVFRRPIYREGKLVDPGYVTVFVNGVLVQDHAVLEGPTGHMARSRPGPFPDKGPLALQDHGNPVRFRNIWYRPLPPRPADGGTDGWLTPEATTAKRKEIAAGLRQEASRLQDSANQVPEMLGLMESLAYEKDDATVQKVEQMASAFVRALGQLPADKIGARKNQAKQLNQALDYLVRFKILPPDFGPKVELGKIIKEQHWNK